MGMLTSNYAAFLVTVLTLLNEVVALFLLSLLK